jgi:cytoskeletal protein RodZ
MLRALEAEDFDRLPADIYVRGFIKSYAALLELDPAELMSSYDSARPEKRSIGALPSLEDTQEEPEERGQVGASLAKQVSEESALRAWLAAARRKGVRNGQQNESRASGGKDKMSGGIGMVAGGHRRVSLGLVLLLIVIAVTLTLSYMLNRSPSAESRSDQPAASETTTNLDWKG